MMLRVEEKIVRVAGNRFGCEVNEQGTLFNLERFTFPGIRSIGEGAFTDIYFRTRSGNIYRLSKQDGVLTNANVSKGIGYAYELKLNLRGFSSDDMSVGHVFEFWSLERPMTLLWTTPIKELVAVYSKPYSAEQHHERSVAGYNNIIEAFEAKSDLTVLRR